MNKWFLLVGLIFAVAIGTSSCRSFDNNESAKDIKNGVVGPEVGQLAPDFTLQTTRGKKVTLSELRGRPVLLNFWTTWCIYCREEMPDIQGLWSEQNKDFEILTVNVTTSEKSPNDVRRFLKEKGYTFPVLLDTEDKASREYLVRSLPTTYIIDAKGIVREKYYGAVSREQMESKLKRAGTSIKK